MVMPTFIGIGAQRAATTWAYECLKLHPQIFMSDKKEIHFFNANYQKGLDWYEEHFKNYKNYLAVGEITPNYINNIEAVPRMARIVPEAKLFIILREPVSRAFSAYKLLHKQFKGQTFQQACQNCRYLLDLSCYAGDLKRVFSYYSREQVGIYLYEDVMQKPVEMLADLYRHINVDPTFKPMAAEQTFNTAIFPGLLASLEMIGLKNPLEKLKNTSIGRWLKQFAACLHREIMLNNDKIKKKKEDQCELEHKKHLKKFFHNDILETQAIIGRDLSSWMS